MKMALSEWKLIFRRINRDKLAIVRDRPAPARASLARHGTGATVFRWLPSARIARVAPPLSPRRTMPLRSPSAIHKHTRVYLTRSGWRKQFSTLKSILIKVENFTAGKGNIIWCLKRSRVCICQRNKKTSPPRHPRPSPLRPLLPRKANCGGERLFFSPSTFDAFLFSSLIRIIHDPGDERSARGLRLANVRNRFPNLLRGAGGDFAISPQLKKDGSRTPGERAGATQQWTVSLHLTVTEEGEEKRKHDFSICRKENHHILN